MDYEGFKREIFKLTDIDLDSYKEKQMKRRIEALIKKNNYDGFAEYVEVLKVDQVLYNEFVNYLTINVSEFYRNPEQWKILEEEVLPMLFKKTKTPRIWSAACSTGDEPYTLSMILSKYMPSDKIKIYATDIDKQAMEKAKEGVYNVKSLESLPEEFKQKYFTKINNDVYKVTDQIKKCVEFKQHDLLKNVYPSGFDLIVCRNVLIYFTEEAKEKIYERFNKSLNEEGILFVGSTEQIIFSNKFNFKSMRTFFYTKTN
ncbi:MAG: protein-glutamate O-methyltransferase CheR [Bacillota bacterium]|nr:protein-glutamate O-methyltransferase CheR [Bacillota bacterium]